MFDWAFAQYPSTLAWHLSIFTGLYPRQHGVVQRDRSLSPELPIIAEVLHEAGFRIFDLGLDFLRSLRPGERPFLWQYTYAVHTPYEPTDASRERFLRGHPHPATPVTGEYLTVVNRGLERADSSDVEALSRLYDGQLRDVDAAFGRFLQGLEEGGWRDRLAIVIFADHGEAELEMSSYRQARPARIIVNGKPAAEVILAPEWSTITLALPQGTDLNRLRVEVPGCERPADVRESTDQRCLSFKPRGGERQRFELYNLSEDPRAQRDRIRHEPRVFRRLLADLKAVPGEPTQPAPEAEAAQQDEDTLRALGYL